MKAPKFNIGDKVLVTNVDGSPSLEIIDEIRITKESVLYSFASEKGLDHFYTDKHIHNSLLSYKEELNEFVEERIKKAERLWR